MEDNKEVSKLKGFGIGIGIFAVVMLLLCTVITWIQMKLGMIGVLLTELIFVLISVVTVILFKQNFKKVFPIKLPKIREVVGTLILWIGTFCFRRYPLW